MAVDVSKLIITEVAQITAFNNAGELEFIMDEVHQKLTGKGGRDREKRTKDSVLEEKQGSYGVCHQRRPCGRRTGSTDRHGNRAGFI